MLMRAFPFASYNVTFASRSLFLPTKMRVVLADEDARGRETRLTQTFPGRFLLWSIRHLADDGVPFDELGLRGLWTVPHFQRNLTAARVVVVDQSDGLRLLIL